MNRDFVEILQELSAAGADCMVVGAMRWRCMNALAQQAISTSGFGRRPRMRRAFGPRSCDFGAPLGGSDAPRDTTPDITFQIGVVPNRIDILTRISGVTFDEAWPNRLAMQRGELEYVVIGREDLDPQQARIRTPKGSGGPRESRTAVALRAVR
jgi:hypothetical protein